MSTMKLADVHADLQRKIHKAKPTVTLYDKGELKVLSEAEEKLVQMYPLWMAALEEAKQGTIPTLYSGKQQPQQQAGLRTPQRGDDCAHSNGAGSSLKPNRRATSTDSAPSLSRRSCNGSSDEGADDLTALFRTIAVEVREAVDASPKQRMQHIEKQVKSLVSTKQLNAALKELDRVSELRSDIRAGRIERPSKAQLSKVQTYDALKRDVQHWRDFVRSQQERMREGIQEAVRRLEMGSDGGDAAQESSAASEAGGSVEGGGDAYEDDACDAAATEKSDGERDSETTEEAETPITTPSVTNNDVTVQAAAGAAVAADVDDSAGANPLGDAAPAAQPEEHVGASQAEIETHVDCAVVDKDNAPAEIPQPVEEEAQPAKPIEIDWSQLSYKKNRPKLVFTAPAAPVAGGPADAVSTGAEKPNATSNATSSLAFLNLDFDGATPSTRAPKGSKKGKAAEPVVPQSPVASAMTSTLVGRVGRELRHALAHPFPNIRVAALGDDVCTWCVNVSPMHGPLCGVVVPLRMSFTPLYPLAPPVLYALVDVPHPNVMTIGSQRNGLCMEHTATDTWDPASGAYSLLMQLQTFFSDENFDKAKKNVATFAQRIRFARRDCSRFVASDASQHCPQLPSPLVDLWNGPFIALQHKPTAGGCLKGPATYTWAHRYVPSGQHSIGVYRGRGNAIDVELTTYTSLSPDAPADRVFAFSLSTGGALESTTDGAGAPPTPSSSKQHQASRKPLGDALPADALEQLGASFWVDIDLKALVWRVVGGPSQKALLEVPLPKETVAVRPTISLGNGTEAACAFGLTNKRPALFDLCLPSDAELVKAFPTDLDVAKPYCFMSLASPSEAVLGPHIEVLTRSKQSFVPLEVRCSVGEYISSKAFEQVKQSHRIGTRRIDGMIPLCLDADHTRRAIPELKKQLMRMARNPNASTLYEPPFRPTAALYVLPAAMNDVVRQICKALPSAPRRGGPDVVTLTAAVDTTLSTLVTHYTMLLHTFATIASETPAMASEATTSLVQPMCGGVSGGHILAWSHLVGTSWPDVLRMALRAEGATFNAHDEGAAAAGRSDTAFNAFPRHKRLHILANAALTKSMRTTSIQRLAEELSVRNGASSDEVLHDIVGSLSTGLLAVKSWDAVEDWVGVSLLNRAS